MWRRISFWSAIVRAAPDQAEGAGGLLVAAFQIAGPRTNLPFHADLLASEAYPVATFVAARFSFDGPQITALSGELTLRGSWCAKAIAR